MSFFAIIIPQWLSGKESACNAGAAGDMGLIPGLGISPEGGNGYALQDSAWRIPWMEEPGGLQYIALQSWT